MLSAVLPDGFRFGVATAGFQVEGGFNGPGEPANNWVGWEGAGRVEPSGIAVDFWNRYEEHFDRARAIGCDAFRLSVEWARVERGPDDVDDTALDRYGAILDACRERGMEPLVSLHHFTHPAWLGEDFWLSGDSPARFASWVERAASHLAPRCQLWVTINEINVLALGAYLLGAFPPGRVMALADVATAIDHLLTAHVRAYEVVHRIRPDAVVTTNNSTLSIYEIDRMLVDVLLARVEGTGRAELGPWIDERRRTWYARQGPPGALESVLRRAADAYRGRFGSLGRAVDAVWKSPHERTLDVIGIDYYDPAAAHQVQLPGHRTAGGHVWHLGAEPWDDTVDPGGLVRYGEANAAPGLGLWVVENGMCNRVRRGRSYPRLDGWDRPRFLRRNLAAVADLVERGTPLGAYYHWTLLDNYEWGSYQPRFGIFGVDRDRGLKVLDTDAMGRDAAGTFRRIVEGLRAGDRSVLDAEG